MDFCENMLEGGSRDPTEPSGLSRDHSTLRPTIMMGTHFLLVLFIVSPLIGQAEATSEFKDKAVVSAAADRTMDRTRADAMRGDPEAQTLVGMSYYLGGGVPEDYVEAVRWFRMAALQGNSGAQVLLGVCYALGQGVPKNYAEAYVWQNLAAANGHPKAPELRDYDAKQLSPQSLKQAQARSRKLFREIKARQAH